jgi:hypothetical protein
MDDTDLGSALPPPAPAPAAPGHNNPPLDLAEVLDIAVLRREIMEAWNTPVVVRRDELLASLSRFEEAYTDIPDEEIQAKASLLVRQMAAHIEIAEGYHKRTKAPVLAASRTIDGLMHEMIDKLQTGAQRVRNKMTAYAQRQRIEAQRKADEEARARQAEADRLAAEAAEIAKRAGPVAAAPALDDAIAADERAADAARAATRVDVAAATRVRTDGAVSSLGGRWTWEVANKRELLEAILAGTVPMDAVDVSKPWADSMLKIKPEIKKSKAQPVPGLRFYIDEKISVR